MFKKTATICVILALVMSMLASPQVFAQDNKDKPETEQAKKESLKSPEELKAYQSKCSMLDPLDLVANPEEYLDKYIFIEGKFDKYTTLGLDYKKAQRDSKDYITFLIRRPDVKRDRRVIPLSELKLIISRKVAENYINLESGDEVKIYGKVFSTALGDPWVDVDHLSSDKKDLTAQPKDKDSASKNELEESDN